MIPPHVGGKDCRPDTDRPADVPGNVLIPEGPYSHAEAEGSAEFSEWKARPSAGLVEASASADSWSNLCLMLLSCVDVCL